MPGNIEGKSSGRSKKNVRAGSGARRRHGFSAAGRPRSPRLPGRRGPCRRQAGLSVAPFRFAANMPGGLIPGGAGAERARGGAAAKRTAIPEISRKDDKLVLSASARWWPRRRSIAGRGTPTPTRRYFVRNNGQIRTSQGAKFLEDHDRRRGQQQARSDVGELKSKFKPVTQRMVLECGGNGARSHATARGNQWTHGGAGLRRMDRRAAVRVLKAAGVKSSAVFTGHYGTDRSLADASKDALFRAACPIKKAMDGNNLIVFAMNGQPLSISTAGRCVWSFRAGGFGVVQVVQPALGARQVSRRSGLGARRTASPSSRWCRATKPADGNSAISNRCRCARSSPVRRTAPSSPPAPKR